MTSTSVEVYFAMTSAFYPLLNPLNVALLALTRLHFGVLPVKQRFLYINDILTPVISNLSAGRPLKRSVTSSAGDTVTSTDCMLITE